MAFNKTYQRALRPGFTAAAVLAVMALAGCHPDMWDQARNKPYGKNEFFANGMSMRMPVEGTFAYDGARREWVHPLYDGLSGETTVPSKTDAAFFTGKVDGAEMPTNYFEKITPELLARGRERFNISCSTCHGYNGEGGGIIVQRGFPVAASFHVDRLREANDGYFFDVITNGFGRMYSYAARVAPEDRWAIIAYIRALQHSQDVDVSVPDSADRQMVLAGIAEQERLAAEAAAAHGAHGDAHGGHGEEAAHGADAHGAAEAPAADGHAVESHGEAAAAHGESPSNGAEHDANAH